ncbi:MAG: phosphodiester glycosidase family protein [Acaryochloridaceae cyanobacterium SU_2_1]|nr:phosphodiester glycosidase family protein [Acaryochloridaceae cyanobacterium SU_2_1]
MASARADTTAPLAQRTPATERQGNQVLLNGRAYPLAWRQWQNSQPGQVSTGVSDIGLERRFGVQLANTDNYQQQPAQWFTPQALSLPTQFSSNGVYRLVDISALAQTFSWRMQAQGNVLQIQSPPTQVQQLRIGRQVWGQRLVLDLDQPAPWQIERLTNSRNGSTSREFAITLDATTPATLAKTWTLPTGSGLQSLQVTSQKGRTTLQGKMAGNMRPRVTMLANPYRLVIDIQNTAPSPRSILWAPGIRWQEQTIALGNRQFPVTWLAIEPQQRGLTLEPIWGNQNGLVGIDPLSTIAQRNQATAAINAGFFNRNNQTPLGALRRNGAWISSPILNRGVLAWNPQGQVQVGRISLQQNLTTATGQRLALVSLDSGYPQKGIARYTPTWGSSYTPLLKTEKIITVVGDRVNSVQSSTSATAFAIPKNGYLLVARSFDTDTVLSPGSQIQIQTTTTPNNFNAFPNILGAGPLLIADGRVVLNAISEQFRPPFDIDPAPRSAIGQSSKGTILLAVAHNRLNGPGPTLSEWAAIMQQLGSVNALNLDGGASTSLYLGGELLDRHPVSAARVQNGIGVFWRPGAL